MGNAGEAQRLLAARWLGSDPLVTADTDPDDGFIRVDGKDASAFWHRPAACLIVHPDGYQQYALTATCHLDGDAVLVLRSGLDDWVPEAAESFVLPVAASTTTPSTCTGTARRWWRSP